MSDFNISIRPRQYPNQISEVLPQAGREKLAAAARVEPDRPIGGSALRTAALEDAIAWCRVEYPKFFKRG